MKTQMSRACRGLMMAIVLAATAGCMPRSVTLNFAPDSARLEETVVMSDPNAAATILLVDVRGLIADANKPGLLGSSPNPVDELVARLRKAERDADVRALILRINSPGGTVTASDIMYREIRGFRERTGKPVVASLGEVAASGGYYIALSADEIIAQPTSITGSIGVLIQTINVSEAMNMLGVRSRTFVSGPNKAMGSPLDPPSAAHDALLQGLVNEFYGRFRTLVVDRRSGAPNPLHMDQVETLTDGRVVTGAEAVRQGLADTEGGLRSAFERAKSLAGVARAALIKYHMEGDDPRSAYSTSASPRPLADDGRSLHVDLPFLTGYAPTGNAYYLWVGMSR